MIQTAPGICDALRSDTRALHDIAEKHPFQTALVAGRVTRHAYGRFLAQMFHVHRTLERCVAQSEHPAVRSVIKSAYFQSIRLTQDLDHIGLDDRSATRGTKRLMAEIESTVAEQPAAALGFHYVLEGSNNGSRYIARSIRLAFNLTEAGTRFLDPYGDDQRSKWLEYRAALDAVNMTPVESAIVLDAAARMFRGVTALCDDLNPETQHGD